MQSGHKAMPALRIVKGTERPDRVPLISPLEPADPLTIIRPGFVKGRAKKLWDAEAPGRTAPAAITSMALTRRCGSRPQHQLRKSGTAEKFRNTLCPRR